MGMYTPFNYNYGSYPGGYLYGGACAGSLVNQGLGTAYYVVKYVADNIDMLQPISDNIDMLQNVSTNIASFATVIINRPAAERLALMKALFASLPDRRKNDPFPAVGDPYINDSGYIVYSV